MPAVDTLKTLHTAMLDTISGYEKAEQEAETPELKTVFGDMVAMRREHHEALHRALVERGEAAADDGSFMGAVHRTVIGVRAAVKGIGRDSLTAFISGEEKNVADYDKAIEAHADDPELPDLLLAQKAALLDHLTKMKHLAAA